MDRVFAGWMIGMALLAACGAHLAAAPVEAHVTRADAERALKDNLLEVWFPRVLDREHGGFLCDFDADWRPAGNQPKSIVFQARMTWLASRAAARYPHDPRYREAADQGFRCLRDVLWDKAHGGWYFHRDRMGAAEPNWQGVKHAYGIGFGIYACAAYYQLTHDPEALALAKQGFEWLDRHGHDASHGGYNEYFAEDGSPVLNASADPLPSHGGKDAIGTHIGFKSMNTHIHLLEAITELHGVWPDPAVKARLAELLALVRDRIVAPPGAMHQFFNPDWTPVPDLDSFGHDIETSYLLMEASAALGHTDDARTLAVAKSMLDHALDYGWDARSGGFFEAGSMFGPVRDRQKIWWTQAEGLNALITMSRHFPNDARHYPALFEQQWTYIQANVMDPRRGEWYEIGLDSGGTADRHKASEWKAGYHDGRALMNVVDWLAGAP